MYWHNLSGDTTIVPLYRNCGLIHFVLLTLSFLFDAIFYYCILFSTAIYSVRICRSENRSVMADRIPPSLCLSHSTSYTPMTIHANMAALHMAGSVIRPLTAHTSPPTCRCQP